MAARKQHQSTGGTELGRFLRTRRTQVSPAEVGLVPGAGLRRTPGLRREEVATLAGMSNDYYTRIEQGKETHPSPAVIDSLARVLRLDEAEHEHLRELAASTIRTPSTPPPSRTVRPGIRLVLEQMRPFPASVISRTLDLLACNPSHLRLFPGMEDWPARQRNSARYLFLHPAARDLFDDWGNQVRDAVARLRTLAGTEPDAPDLTSLVSELLLKSPDFTRLWERYEVVGHSHGRKTFHHPDVGDLALGYEAMDLGGTPGHRLITYYAEPGSAEHDALIRLDKTAHDQSPQTDPGQELSESGAQDAAEPQS